MRVPTRRAAAITMLAASLLTLSACGQAAYPDASNAVANQLGDAVCGAGNWDSSVELSKPSGAAWYYTNVIVCTADPGRGNDEYEAAVMGVLGTGVESVTGPDANGRWYMHATPADTRWGDLQLIAGSSNPPNLRLRTFV